MSKTKNEVRDRVATDYLGILRLGQSLQSQDSTRILESYDEVYQQLKNDGLASWATTASVPAAIVPYLTALIAKECIGTYSLSPARQRIIFSITGVDGELAKREIRKIVSQDYASQNTARDY